MKKEKIIGLVFSLVLISLVITQVVINYPGVNYYESNDYVMDVYVENDIAYLFRSESGLVIMDVSNPSKPSELSRISTLNGNNLYVDGNYAFFTKNGKIKIIQVSDPSNPYLVNKSGFEISDIDGMYIDFPLAYLIHSSELSIVRMGPFFNFSEIGHIGLNCSLDDIQVDGSIAYIASYHGLKIIDLSNLTNPIELSQYTPDDYDDWYRRCLFKDDVIYVVGGWGVNKEYIDIIDVSNPSNPIKLGHYKDMYGYPEDLAIHDNILYVANLRGISLIDVSNPSKPVQFDQVKLTDASDLYIEYPIAYVGCSYSGFKIINISNPSSWDNIPIILNFIITMISLVYVAGIILFKLLIKNKEVKR
ncbi:MAG: LVIVD repeat-containing protein [Promethearchaeota archaeon]